MNNNIVLTSNVRMARGALTRLLSRDSGREEGMALLYGRPGEGKTTAVGYLMNQYDAVFLRANIAWTTSITAMLQALMRELEHEPLAYRAPMLEVAIEVLARTGRPLFVDEADYCLRNMDLLDALRDIYDSARAPVVLITMETAPRIIRSSARLARFRRRITEWIEFQGLSLEDARQVAAELVDVRIEEDLLDRLHRETDGNIGLMVPALGRVEQAARASGLEAISLETFGARGLLPGGLVA